MRFKWLFSLHKCQYVAVHRRYVSGWRVIDTVQWSTDCVLVVRLAECCGLLWWWYKCIYWNWISICYCSLRREQWNSVSYSDKAGSKTNKWKTKTKESFLKVLVLLRSLHVSDPNISAHLTRGLAILQFPCDAVGSNEHIVCQECSVRHSSSIVYVIYIFKDLQQISLTLQPAAPSVHKHICPDCVLCWS